MFPMIIPPIPSRVIVNSVGIMVLNLFCGSNLSKLDKKFTYLPFNTKKRFGYEDYFALSSIKDAKKISNWFLCRNKYALTTPDSIRQHFDKFNIQIKPFLRVGKDFLLYRNIFFSKKMIIFRFVNYLKSFFKNNK